MPEVPRDPRQLARDILSGKISIEDIARERQKRAPGGGAPTPQPPTAAPQARTPERIPLPKQPSSLPPVQRPVVRQPAPVQRPQRPAPQSQQKPRPQQQKPRPQQQSQQPAHVIQMAQSAQTTAYDAPKAIQDAKVNVAVINKPLDIRALTQNRTSIRQGLLMAEILGKPLALRDTY